MTARSRDTRRIILEAAERALKAKGLLGASTREIAREAGVADGTLYVHFNDRIELFLALIQEHLPPYVEPIILLRQRVGRRTVRANLTDVLEGTLSWHERLMPVFSAIMADPALSAALRQRLAERNEGPHLAVRGVAAYLEAEQKLGRVNPKAKPIALAIALFGTSHFWSAACFGLGNNLGYDRKQLVKDAINSLALGLEPRTALPRRAKE